MKKNAQRTLAWMLTLTMLMTTAVFAETPEAAPAGSDSAHVTCAEVRETPDIPVETGKITLPEAGTYCEGELLVKMKQSVSLQSAEDVFAEYARDCEFLFSVEDTGSLSV